MSERDANHDHPLLVPEPAPEHRPGFWIDLGARLRAPDAGSPDPAVSYLDRAETITALVPNMGAGRARRWPLAAAAVIVLLGGLALAVRLHDGAEPITEVVQAPTTDSMLVPLDGTEGEGGSAPGGAATPGPGGATPAPTSLRASPEPPTLVTAPGAEGATVYLPADGGIPDGASFLGTWEQNNVSWFAITDPARSCDEQRYAEMRYTGPSGRTAAVRDPQLWFSGEIAHLSLRPGHTDAAWIVSCGTQVEFYAAGLAPTGEVERLHLVWQGTASPDHALVQWNGSEVALNAIGAGGQPFNVGYDPARRSAVFNGETMPELLGVGAPTVASGSPLGADPDGRFSYWGGTQGSPPVSACNGLAPVGDSLWLRGPDGSWVPALADPRALGEVTALAIESASAQVAFVDMCAGTAARLFFGTQGPDGRIADVHEVDLAPYSPGFVDQLFWADGETLRLETDNTSRGFSRVRFDFRFDDGFDQGVVVQLD